MKLNSKIKISEKNRTSIHDQEFPKSKNKSEEKLPIINGKMKVSVTQKEEKIIKVQKKGPATSINRSIKSSYKNTKKPIAKNTKNSQSPKKGATTKQK